MPDLLTEAKEHIGHAVAHLTSATVALAMSTSDQRILSETQGLQEAAQRILEELEQ